MQKKNRFPFNHAQTNIALQLTINQHLPLNYQDQGFTVYIQKVQIWILAMQNLFLINIHDK